MIIIAIAENRRIPINVGLGGNNIKWLCLVVAYKLSKVLYPHYMRIPSEAQLPSGVTLSPRNIIRTSLAGGGEIYVLFQTEGSSLPGKLTLWSEEAFNLASSHLCWVFLEWEVDRKSNIIPNYVSGKVTVSKEHALIYRVGTSFVEFKLPLDPIGDSGNIRWIAKFQTCPGICKFHFYTDESTATPLTSKFHPVCDSGENFLLIEPDIPV